MKKSSCVRGRLCAIHCPGHWTRDLLRHPPCAAELPDEFEQSFLIGKPRFFSEHDFLPEACIFSLFRFLFLIVTSFSCCLFPFTSLEVCFRALLV